MKSEVKVTGKRLQITRVFDAPRAIVFAWWSQADKLERWSGCKEATKCHVEMDFRVGGSFTQRMHVAGKGEFTLTGTYDDIRVPERISYRADLGHAVTHVVVEFFEEGNRTRIVVTEDGFRDEVSCKIVSHGIEESLDKLNTILAGEVVAERCD